MVGLYVHVCNHSRTVTSRGLVLWGHALTKVQNWMYLLVCRVWAIWWIALVCWAMRRPSIYWFEDVDSRCDHVSIVLFGHNVQIRFGWVVDHRIFLQCLPIYWVSQSFSVCIICVFEMPCVVQKWFESLWFISSLNNHLSTYENFDMVVAFFSGIIYVCTGLGVGWHHHVIMLGHCSTNMVGVWAMCMRNVVVDFSMYVPSFAN